MEGKAAQADFKRLAATVGMCPATALLEPDASAGVGLEADPTGNLHGQLPHSRLLECVCEGASVGGQSFLECLLRAPWRSGVFNVLVDAAHAFDPGTLGDGLETALLWVRVGDGAQLVRSLDLLLRDENFALVAADMRGLSTAQVQAIQPFEWYRLQRLAHQRSGACVVFSDQASVRCADQRVHLRRQWCLKDLDRTRAELLAALEAGVQYRKRGAPPVGHAAGAAALAG